MPSYTLNICILPLEIKWEIIKHLDIKSARRVSTILGLSLTDVYRYYSFELESDTKELFPVLKEISGLIQENACFYQALLLNKRFQKIDANYSLLLAAGFELTQQLESLLKNPSVDPQCWNNMPLLVSAANGKTRIVSLLLKDGRIDPSVLNNSALDLAIKFGHSETISILETDDRVKQLDNFEDLISKKSQILSG